MQAWILGALANVVIAVAYALIAWTVLRGVHHSGQWQTNPLAVATGLIFLSCGVGHAFHVEHLLLAANDGVVREFWDWHLTLIDGVTAAIGVRYLLLRNRFGALLRGQGAVFEDLAVRRREALDLHDHVVQQLATAKLAFEMEQPELGLRALDDGLASARTIVSDLTRPFQDPRAPQALAGNLRRTDRAIS